MQDAPAENIAFGTPAVYSNPSGPKASTLGDLNRDGRPDVMCATDSSATPLWSMLNNGTGTLLAPVALPVAGSVTSFAAGDLDGDGARDIAFFDRSVTGLTILLGDGTGGTRGAFTKPLPSPGTVPLRGLGLTDVDLDGQLDVVIVVPNASTHLPFGFAPAGGGIPGVDGEPLLTGSGSLNAGGGVTLKLRQAAPSAPVFMVMGFAQAGLPLLGGTLVPAPDLVISGLVTGALGSLELNGPWPSAIGPGFTTWLQFWIPDAVAPFGVSASQGLTIKVP